VSIASTVVSLTSGILALVVDGEDSAADEVAIAVSISTAAVSGVGSVIALLLHPMDDDYDDLLRQQGSLRRFSRLPTGERDAGPPEDAWDSVLDIYQRRYGESRTWRDCVEAITTRSADTPPSEPTPEPVPPAEPVDPPQEPTNDANPAVESEP
jgi:hypothetical protein